MTLTILAIVFLIGLVALAAFGFRLVFKPGTRNTDLNTEHCTICRKRFERTMLVERQVGDYKMLYFCAECIEGMHKDVMSRN